MFFIEEKKLNEVYMSTLSQGGHGSKEEGMCAMEAVSYFTGEEWSDAPRCVDPMIAGIMRRWNDVLPDAERTRLLLPYLTMVVGTRSTADGIERRRRSKLTVWTVQSMLPLWLDLVGETHGAALLRNHLFRYTEEGIVDFNAARRAIALACEDLSLEQNDFTPLASVRGVAFSYRLRELSEAAWGASYYDVQAAQKECIRLACSKYVRGLERRENRAGAVLIDPSTWERLHAETAPFHAKVNRQMGHLIEALCFVG